MERIKNYLPFLSKLLSTNKINQDSDSDAREAILSNTVRQRLQCTNILDDIALLLTFNPGESVTAWEAADNCNIYYNKVGVSFRPQDLDYVCSLMRTFGEPKTPCFLCLLDIVVSECKAAIVYRCGKVGDAFEISKKSAQGSNQHFWTHIPGKQDLYCDLKERLVSLTFIKKNATLSKELDYFIQTTSSLNENSSESQIAKCVRFAWGISTYEKLAELVNMEELRSIQELGEYFEACWRVYRWIERQDSKHPGSPIYILPDTPVYTDAQIIEMAIARHRYRIQKARQQERQQERDLSIGICAGVATSAICVIGFAFIRHLLRTQ